MATTNKQTVSLVLGSGGARGLAHIGVIKWLEEHNFKIESISGSSMGAVVGGIYAVGKLNEYEEWVCTLDKMDVFSLLDISWRRSGLVKGQKIINSLIGLVGEALIEDLPISFTAVASDIKNEKEIWIQTGNLFDAMKASFAIPLLFTPFNYKGAPIVDGGVLNPVPIAPTFGDQTDVTIAVNLGGPAKTPENVSAEKTPTSDQNSVIKEKISSLFGSLYQSDVKAEEPEWRAYDIAMQAIDAMQSTIARQKLAVYPPDVILEIPKNACGTLDFDQAAEMIELGYQTAERLLPVKLSEVFGSDLVQKK